MFTKIRNNLKSIAVIAVIVITSSLTPPLPTRAAYDSTGAQSYLLAHSNNAWATMALSALGAPSIPSDYLKTVSAGAAIDYTAPILAITAIGQNPRSFGDKDYVAELEKYYSNGQLGDESTLNDDIFGLLALSSAGETSSNPVISGTKNYLLAHQNSDGGWGFSTGGSSDSNMTAGAVLALLGTGTGKSDSQIQNAVNFLKTAQNNDGGFTYDPKSSYGTASDSSSTAWVVWALNAIGEAATSPAWSKQNGNPISYLESNQDSSGFFKFQAGSTEDNFSAVTTAYASIALAGKFLPLKTIAGADAPAPSFPFRIEGSQNTICSGTAQGPTALDVVKNTKDICGFSYEIKTTSLGQYLYGINDDKAQGLTGWLYLVNDVSQQVGAASYQMKQGDSLLWYYGDFDWKPARLTLSATEVESGQTAQAIVESFDGNSWQPLPQATVSFGALTATTANDGTAAISAPDGYYKIGAQKDGFVRTDTTLLKIGEPSSQSANLSVDILPGSVQGDSTSSPQSSISFSINPDSLDFGQLPGGGENSKDLSITNNGSADIKVESIVKGHSVFVDNLMLSDLGWRNYKTMINKGQSNNIKIKLRLPKGKSPVTGKLSGTITFWATAQTN